MVVFLAGCILAACPSGRHYCLKRPALKCGIIFPQNIGPPTIHFAEASSANMATWPKTQHENIKARKYEYWKNRRFSLQSEDFEGNKTVCSWLFRRGFAMIALFIGCLLAQGMPWKLRCSCFDTLLHQWWSTRAPENHQIFTMYLWCMALGRVGCLFRINLGSYSTAHIDLFGQMDSFLGWELTFCV